ncbi:MAG: hypothetical protein AB7S38_10805 [Vulcanimicrobiota bacterium]
MRRFWLLLILATVGCAGPPSTAPRPAAPIVPVQQQVFSPPQLHVEPGLERVWQNGPTEAETARWRGRLEPQGHSEHSHLNNGAPVFLDDSESVPTDHE